jgi:hypothetical protein
MYRFIAIFFLLWTLVDLSVPQVCMADFDAPAAATAGASKNQTILSTSSQSHDAGSSSVPYQQDDDCFCCCCHVLPSSFIRVERLKAVSSVEREKDGLVPYRPINAPFHPPRI